MIKKVRRVLLFLLLGFTAYMLPWRPMHQRMHSIFTTSVAVLMFGYIVLLFIEYKTQLKHRR